MSLISPSPQVLDAGKRVLRTLVQVIIPSVIALAAVLPPLLVQAHAVLSPQLYAELVALAAGITAAAAVLAKVMANPTVNALLGKVGLAGHSGTTGTVGPLPRASATPQDALTGYVQTIPAPPPAPADPAQVAPGPQPLDTAH